MSGKVILIEDFELKELGRKRTLRVYLPTDNDSSDKRYPVLYMHDGQNLYDDATAAYGVSWGVSDILDERFNNGNHNGIIVVGIDNHAVKRLDEYSPWVGVDYPGTINPRYFGGEGFQYIDSIVNSVKPYMDANFTTLVDRENTIISGSSMGGYISLAAIFKYPQIFGKAAAFSSAIWFNENALLDFIKDQGMNLPIEIYMDTGTKEGTVADYQMYIDSNQRTADLIESFANARVTFVLDEDGIHNEKDWRKRFPGMLEILRL